MKKILLSLVFIISGTYFLFSQNLSNNDTKENNNPICVIRENAGAEISEIDTLIKHKYPRALRVPYDKETIESNINWVSSMPEKVRSEYFNSVYYYFDPLVRNYGKYTVESNNIISRFRDIIDNVAGKYDSWNQNQRQANMKNINEDLLNFATTGTLYPPKSRTVPIQFDYFKFYKDSYQTIPFLNDCLNEAYNIITAFIKDVPNTADVKRLGKESSNKMTIILDKLNNRSTAPLKESASQVVTQVINDKEESEQIVVSEVINTQSETEGDDRQSESEKLSEPIKPKEVEATPISPEVMDVDITSLTSIPKIKSKIQTLPDDESTREPTMKFYINETSSAMQSVKRKIADTKKTISKIEENLKSSSGINKKLFENQLGQEKRKYVDFNKDQEKLKERYKELLNMYKEMFNKDFISTPE